MTRDELNNAYFDWMYQLVCDDEYSRGLSYRKLLSLLHDTDFTYTIALASGWIAWEIRCFFFRSAVIYCSIMGPRPPSRMR